MPSTESIVVYLFLFVPVFVGLIYLFVRCFYRWFERPTFFVETIPMVLSIHTTEPLEIAEPIYRLDSQDLYEQDIQSAIPFPNEVPNEGPNELPNEGPNEGPVEESFSIPNQEAIYI